MWSFERWLFRNLLWLTNFFFECFSFVVWFDRNFVEYILIISWKHRKRKLTYIHLTFFALITIAFDLRMNLVGFYFWHGAALGVADSTSLGKFVFFGLRGHKRYSITIFVEQYWWACCGYLHLIVYSVTNVTWASHRSTATVRSEGSGIIGNGFVTSWTYKKFT